MEHETFVCHRCNTAQSSTFRHCKSVTCPWCTSCYAAFAKVAPRPKGET